MKDQRLITNFTCDECGNKSDQRTLGQGFPYDDGWRFLYKLAIKKERHQRFVIKYKHFCCSRCMSMFIDSKLKGGKNMPITRKQYESGNFKKRSLAGESNYVLDFLRKEDKAYLPMEIAKAVKRSDSTVRQKLRELIKKRLVERTVPYYIVVKKKTSNKKKRK